METSEVYQVWHLTDEDMDLIMEKPHKGVYMTPARPQTGWFHKALLYAHAVLFVRGEPVILIATAPEFVGILEAQKNLGLLVRINRENPSNGH